MKYSELCKLREMDLKRWGGVKHISLYLFKREYKLVYRYRMVKYLESHKWMWPFYMFERYLYNRSCMKCVGVTYQVMQRLAEDLKYCMGGESLLIQKQSSGITSQWYQVRLLERHIQASRLLEIMY